MPQYLRIHHQNALAYPKGSDVRHTEHRRLVIDVTAVSASVQPEPLLMQLNYD